jgi:ABC-type glycerol-3-phosphate transport system substrate-binding protein
VALLGLNSLTAVHAQKEVKITAWTHDQLYIDYFKTRTAEFEKAHPDIKFTWDWVVKPDAPAAALQALAAGEPIPDLLGIERGQFPNFMKNGIIEKYFLDLTDLIKDPSQYSQARMAIYTYNGKLYALESQLAASVFYYQPKLYKDNGLEVPKTWEEMVADGDKLGPKGIAQDFVTDNGTLFHMFLHQRGGLVFDKDAKFVLGDATNKPLAVEVATLIQNGVKNGTFTPVLGGDVWNGATIPTLYRSGKLLGTVMPDWWSSCCLQPWVKKDMSGQWAVSVPPVWKGGGHKTLTWGGTGWAVSSQSPNAALAKEFLSMAYLGKESQVLKFVAINNFPWMFEAYKDPRVIGLEDPFFGGQKLGEIYAQVADDVPTWYQSPFLANFYKAAGDNMPALFDGKMTPEEFVDAVIKTTQDAIDFGG